MATTVLSQHLGIPASKFNDDRLGRTLDTLAAHKREIWLEVVHQAWVRFDTDLRFLFYDLTACVVSGAYAESQWIERLENLEVIATQCWEGSVLQRPTPVDAEQAQLLCVLAEVLQEVFQRGGPGLAGGPCERSPGPGPGPCCRARLRKVSGGNRAKRKRCAAPGLGGPGRSLSRLHSGEEIVSP